MSCARYLTAAFVCSALWPMAQGHADQLAPKLLEYLAVRDKSLFEEAVRQLPAFDFPPPVSKAADELSTAEST